MPVCNRRGNKIIQVGNQIYENLDVDKAIKKYNVLKIVTKHNTPLQYGYNIHIENNYGNIYLREQ